MVGVIAACYLVETVLEQPDWAAVGAHHLHLRFVALERLLVSTGRLGTTALSQVISLRWAVTPCLIVPRLLGTRSTDCPLRDARCGDCGADLGAGKGDGC